MKTLTQKYPVTNEIHDFFRTFEDDLSKPQMGRAKEVIHGILRGRKAILSEVARQNRGKEGKSIRKQVQQYSNMLQNLPLETMLTRKLKGFRPQISAGTALYFDLVDITKLYHRGMEAIGNTWNGSEGKPGKGYEIMDISLPYGEVGAGGAGESCVTLVRHTYSTAEEGYKSQNEELKKVLCAMKNAWGEIRGTIFFDAGGDSDLTIKTLTDFEASLAIRMNVNRGKSDRLFQVERDEGADTGPTGGKAKSIMETMKMMDLWKKKAQGMSVWEDKKRKKKKLVQLQWRKVHKRIGRELTPFYLVWCHREGDPDPCIFLTTRIIETEADAARLYHQYFARGMEEAVFKCHKDKLGMEMVQLCSLKKVKQLMRIYALVDQLLHKLHCKALDAKNTVFLMIKTFLKGTQRQITKWAVIDWYDDCWQKMERLTFRLKRRYPPPDADVQMTLSFNPTEKW